MGELSGGSIWAVCHGYVWLHDRHRDSGTSGHCGYWIRRSDFVFSLVLHFKKKKKRFSHVTGRWPIEFYTRLSNLCVGEDMESLLFHFLDDWLYKFCADLFFVPRVCWCRHSSAIDFHFPLTWFIVFLLLYGLTTSPLGNQSLEHWQNALQDPLYRASWSKQNMEKKLVLFNVFYN